MPWAGSLVKKHTIRPHRWGVGYWFAFMLPGSWPTDVGPQVRMESGGVS